MNKGTGMEGHGQSTDVIISIITTTTVQNEENAT